MRFTIGAMITNEQPETLMIDGEETEVPAGAVAWKQADAVEDACWLYDEVEAKTIDHDEPGVVVWTPSRLAGSAHLN